MRRIRPVTLSMTSQTNTDNSLKASLCWTRQFICSQFRFRNAPTVEQAPRYKTPRAANMGNVYLHIGTYFPPVLPMSPMGFDVPRRSRTAVALRTYVCTHIDTPDGSRRIQYTTSLAINPACNMSFMHTAGLVPHNTISRAVKILAFD